jgi:glycosyltransferase involved in cell wall biosynthesis
MPELIQDKLSGFLVNNLDEAVEAVKKIASINRKACYDYATKKFSYEKMIDEYIKVYQQIIQST